jgi:class 3 adenylate cyclase
MNANDIDNLLDRHIGETTGTLRNCSVSELARGECTSRTYFIFKIDLTNSTVLLRNQKPAMYARIAHAYLSTVDAITQQYGAEPEQTEYHGDSVLALFPERGNTAIEIVSAAVQAHYAVHRLRKLVGIALYPKVLLHFAPLAVAKIGPWNDTHRVAIGLPIHSVAKREKELATGRIWLSDQLGAKLAKDFHQQLLDRSYVKITEYEQVPVPTPAPPPSSAWSDALQNPTVGLLSSLGAFVSPPAQAHSSLLASGLESLSTRDDLSSLMSAISTNKSASGIPTASDYASALADLAGFAAPPPPRYETRSVTKQKPDGYELRLIPAYRQLDLPLAVLSDS